ncbi:MAG TPA: hypothetical protein VGJ70_01005, partial [Solirubrobacteraceae bacterium]
MPELPPPPPPPMSVAGVALDAWRRARAGVGERLGPARPVPSYVNPAGSPRPAPSPSVRGNHAV